MTVQTFALVFLAAILHAAWNLISKRAAPAGASSSPPADRDPRRGRTFRRFPAPGATVSAT